MRTGAMSPPAGQVDRRHARAPGVIRPAPRLGGLAEPPEIRRVRSAGRVTPEAAAVVVRIRETLAKAQRKLFVSRDKLLAAQRKLRGRA